MDMRFVGYKTINPSKHLNRSGLHLNHLGTPIFTVNFLNVLNSLDSEQRLKSKGSKNSDENLGKSEALLKSRFCVGNLLRTYLPIFWALECKLYNE